LFSYLPPATPLLLHPSNFSCSSQHPQHLHFTPHSTHLQLNQLLMQPYFTWDPLTKIELISFCIQLYFISVFIVADIGLKYFSLNFFLKFNRINALKLINSLVRGPLFKSFILILALYFIKEFYDPNYLYRFIFCNLDSVYFNVTMTGITSPSFKANPALHFIINLNGCHTFWQNLHPNSTMWFCLLSTISLSFVLKVNFKIYFKKLNTNINSKVK
jgi:hypothetical protein